MFVYSPNTIKQPITSTASTANKANLLSYCKRGGPCALCTVKTEGKNHNDCKRFTATRWNDERCLHFRNGDYCTYVVLLDDEEEEDESDGLDPELEDEINVLLDSGYGGMIT